MSNIEIPCIIMRGGTSKGLFFLAEDLPDNTTDRDRVLLSIMGSPDHRQIDGLGGAHPLTSKVAIISPTPRDNADLSYLFLQVSVDKAEVTDSQNCGNLLAAVGPFAIETGLIGATGSESTVRIRMENTGDYAVARINTTGGTVNYEGPASIDGVPGTAAPIMLDFVPSSDTVVKLLPTRSVIDRIDDIDVTCVDNGMPVAIMRASDFGLTGYESPRELEENSSLTKRIEQLRISIGHQMSLGDVSQETVPKMVFVAQPTSGGNICTRSFIPHCVHESIGVLGAASVAAACALEGSVAFEVARFGGAGSRSGVEVEHPSGSMKIEVETEASEQGIRIKRTSILRTANILMRGVVIVPNTVWSGEPC